MAGPMDFMRNNNQMLTQLGLGLLSGRTGQEQAALGAQGLAGAINQNKTMQYLQKSYPDLAEAVQSGALTPGDAWKMAYTQKLEAAKPKNNFINAGKNLYNVDSGQWITPPAGMGGDDEEWGLNPVWGEVNGKTVLGQLSKSGKFKPLDTGDFNPTPTLQNIDTGTSILGRNSRTGAVVTETPKNLAEAESQKAQGTSEGKALAEAKSEYDSITSKMPGLYGVVDRLDKLSQDATYTTAGKGVDLVRKELGMAPRDAAVARAEYTAVVDNQILPLLRDTFGAQFTAEEGQRLARTLGDPDKSPTEKQALLRAFIQQKERDIQALSTRLGAVPSQGGAPTTTQGRPGGTTGSGVRWSVE